MNETRLQDIERDFCSTPRKREAHPVYCELVAEVRRLRESLERRIKDHNGHIHPLGHFCGSNCPKYGREES